MPEPYLPTLRDMLALEVPLDVRVSPGGSRAAISVRRADWNEKRLRMQCLVYDQGRDRALPAHPRRQRLPDGMGGRRDAGSAQRPAQQRRRPPG